jgi:hypothetical protein
MSKVAEYLGKGQKGYSNCRRAPLERLLQTRISNRERNVRDLLIVISRLVTARADSVKELGWQVNLWTKTLPTGTAQTLAPAQRGQVCGLVGQLVGVTSNNVLCCAVCFFTVSNDTGWSASFPRRLEQIIASRYRFEVDACKPVTASCALCFFQCLYW